MCLDLFNGVCCHDKTYELSIIGASNGACLLICTCLINNHSHIRASAHSLSHYHHHPLTATMDAPPAGTQLPAQNNDEENKRAQEEQMRRDVMATILDTAARERRACLAFLFLVSSDIDFALSVQNCSCQPGKGKTNRGDPFTNGAIGSIKRTSYGRTTDWILGPGMSSKCSGIPHLTHLFPRWKIPPPRAEPRNPPLW